MLPELILLPVVDLLPSSRSDFAPGSSFSRLLPAFAVTHLALQLWLLIWFIWLYFGLYLFIFFSIDLHLILSMFCISSIACHVQRLSIQEPYFSLRSGLEAGSSFETPLISRTSCTRWVPGSHCHTHRSPLLIG